ncbi:MAG: hypothetical protein ACRDKX_02925, partial [Solirubrobacterales bacterium]
RSKQASCGFAATQTDPAPAISSSQWTATALAASSAADPGWASPRPSCAGSGSRPRQTWLRRSSTRPASRSANGSVLVSP